MTNISIIGSGNMGQALAQVFQRGNHNVELLGQGDTDKPVSGDIVILATPFPALDTIVAHRSEQLAGKVVVDISNPLNFETFDSLVVPADSSAAQIVASKLPQSKVLKAFNTTFAGTLASGQVGGVPTTVLVAGDDEGAKTLLLDAIRSGGMRALDAGSLKRARELEALGFLQLTLAASEKISWTGGFGILN